jgi:HSP20 family protein
MARELKNQKESQNLERSRLNPRQEFWPATYSPFGMMRRFADDLDQMFEGYGFPSLHRFRPWGEQRFSPQVDVFERDGKLVIHADLPGLNKDNVNVDVSEHSVTIEGERKCEHEEKKEGLYSCERSYGHFRREIPLPEGVKAETAKANFKNGILEITFEAPAATSKTRRIPIDEGGGSKRGETAA